MAKRPKIQGSSEPGLQGSSAVERLAVNQVVGGSTPPPEASVAHLASEAPPATVPPAGVLSAFVGDDGRSLDPASWEGILRAYAHARCSLVKTAKTLALPLGTLRRWVKEDQAFGEALAGIKAMMDDTIHAQYLDRVLNPDERNPAWAIFYLKQNLDQYAAKTGKNTAKVEIVIADATFANKPKDTPVPKDPPCP